MALQEIGKLLFFVAGVTGDKTASNLVAANDGSFQMTLTVEGQAPVVIGVGRPDTISSQILSVRVNGNGVDTTVFRSQ